MFLAHPQGVSGEAVVAIDRDIMVAGANPARHPDESRPQGAQQSGSLAGHAAGHYHQASILRQESSRDRGPAQEAWGRRGSVHRGPPAAMYRQASERGVQENSGSWLQRATSGVRTTMDRQGSWMASRIPRQGSSFLAGSSGHHQIERQGSTLLQNRMSTRVSASERRGSYVGRSSPGFDQGPGHEMALPVQGSSQAPQHQGTAGGDLNPGASPTIVKGAVPMFLPGFLEEESGINSKLGMFQRAVRKVIATTWISHTSTVTFDPACKYCKSELYRMHKLGMSIHDCLRQGVHCRFCRNPLLTSGSQDLDAEQKALDLQKRRERGEIQAEIRKMREIAYQRKRELRRTPSWVEEHRAKLLEEIHVNNEKLHMPKYHRRPSLAPTADADSSDDSLDKEYEQETAAYDSGTEPTPEGKSSAMTHAQKLKVQANTKQEIKMREARERNRRKAKKSAIQDLNDLAEPREEPIALQGITKATVRRIICNTMVLNQLKDDEVEELLKYVVMLRYPKGFRIVNQGEEDDTVFTVVEGHVDIYQNNSWCDRVESGGVFGEISIVKSIPRTATVVATSPVICMEFAGDVLDFVFRHRSILWTYMLVLADERIEDNKRHKLHHSGHEGDGGVLLQGTQNEEEDAGNEGQTANSGGKIVDISHGPSFPQQDGDSNTDNMTMTPQLLDGGEVGPEDSRRSSMISLSDTEELPNPADIRAQNTQESVSENDSNVFNLTKVDAEGADDASAAKDSEDNGVLNLQTNWDDDQPRRPSSAQAEGSERVESPVSEGMEGETHLTSPPLVVSISGSRRARQGQQTSKENRDPNEESQSKGVRGQLQAALEFSSKQSEPAKESILAKDFLSFLHSKPFHAEANLRPGSRESELASFHRFRPGSRGSSMTGVSSSRPGSRESHLPSKDPLRPSSRQSVLSAQSLKNSSNMPASHQINVPIEVENSGEGEEGAEDSTLPEPVSGNIIPPIAVHLPINMHVHSALNSPTLSSLASKRLGSATGSGEMSPGPLFGWGDSSPPSPTSQDHKRHFNSVRMKLIEQNARDARDPMIKVRQGSTSSDTRSKTSLGFAERDPAHRRTAGSNQPNLPDEQVRDRMVRSAMGQHRVNSTFVDEEAVRALEANLKKELIQARDCHVFELKIASSHPVKQSKRMATATDQKRAVKKGQCHTAFLLTAAGPPRA